jgi:elongation factor 1-delta
MDVKKWDDEKDMKIMEKDVREISKDGILWGDYKIVKLEYGIKKIKIYCVVEEDKV